MEVVTSVGVIEEGFAAPVEEAANPFKGALVGAPLVTPPAEEESHHDGGTRVVPATPAESGIRQQPSAAALASEMALRAAQEPNRAQVAVETTTTRRRWFGRLFPSSAPAGEVAEVEVVQFPSATPAAVETPAAAEPATPRPKRRWGAWVAALIILGLAVFVADTEMRRSALRAELGVTQGVVAALRVEVANVKARISSLKAALAYEQGRPWWSRLNKWW